jgi:predicted transcriptional regulator
VDAALVLREARRRAGLSQRALAERAGVPQSTVARIELGTIDARVSTLDKLLRVCGDQLEAVPRIGAGVDRTVMRQLLQLPPTERVRVMVESANNLAQLREEMRRSMRDAG